MNKKNDNRISVKELAELIGVSIHTIRRAFLKGENPAIRVRTALPFDLNEVRRCMQRKTEALYGRRGSAQGGDLRPRAVCFLGTRNAALACWYGMSRTYTTTAAPGGCCNSRAAAGNRLLVQLTAYLLHNLVLLSQPSDEFLKLPVAVERKGGQRRDIQFGSDLRIVLHIHREDEQTRPESLLNLLKLDRQGATVAAARLPELH